MPHCLARPGQVQRRRDQHGLQGTCCQRASTSLACGPCNGYVCLGVIGGSSMQDVDRGACCPSVGPPEFVEKTCFWRGLTIIATEPTPTIDPDAGGSGSLVDPGQGVACVVCRMRVGSLVSSHKSIATAWRSRQIRESTKVMPFCVGHVRDIAMVTCAACMCVRSMTAPSAAARWSV